MVPGGYDELDQPEYVTFSITSLAVFDSDYRQGSTRSSLLARVERYLNRLLFYLTALITKTELNPTVASRVGDC